MLIDCRLQVSLQLQRGETSASLQLEHFAPLELGLPGML